MCCVNVSSLSFLQTKALFHTALIFHNMKVSVPLYHHFCSSLSNLFPIPFAPVYCRISLPFSHSPNELYFIFLSSPPCSPRCPLFLPLHLPFSTIASALLPLPCQILFAFLPYHFPLVRFLCFPSVFHITILSLSLSSDPLLVSLSYRWTCRCVSLFCMSQSHFAIIITPCHTSTPITQHFFTLP